MYRGRNWTMRQIAGFGTGADTNGRFRYLIEQGQTGLSVDFDMPTLMGYDSDDPRSLGEVGREGVAIDTLDDMEALFADIDLERISVSMTINPSAWILLAMYVALAESRGFDLNKLSGTVQADILKEYIAQKEWIFPIRPSMRVMRDMIVWSARNLARYNPINISGYHISEAGATSVQELAFTMANAIAYVEEVTRAGVPVDEFAPRLAFYFVAQADFFEEVAKFRAARRIYARLMKERFGATKAESMRLRFHCQTAAATLTKAQPLNNIIRTALPGALRGAGRGPVAPHQRHGRGLRDPLRGGDEDRAAHPADHRDGDARAPGGGSARRVLLRRGADQPRRGRGPAHPRQGGRDGRHHQGHRGRASSSTRSPTPPTTSPGARRRASSP